MRGEAGFAFIGNAALNRLCVRLFAGHHFQFDDVDDRLVFARWAIERKVQQYRIFENLDHRLVIADRAANPKRFFFHDPPVQFNVCVILRIPVQRLFGDLSTARRNS